MKTIKNIFAGILVVSAVMSCSRIEINSVHPSESQEPEMVPVTVTVSHEDVKDVDSKVYITGTGSFKWKSGDQISLFAGGVNNPLTNSTEDGSIAEFGGTVPAESGFPQYALYPYQKNAALNGDGSITATLPKVQTVVEAGDFYQCPEALLSVGKLDDAGSQLQLKNVFSLVMITVPAETSFSSITLLSNNGEPLSGTVKVNPESAECSVVSGDPVVTIKPANGTLAAGKYMVAVLPETLKGGIKVIVVADAVKQRNNTGEIKFNRNEGLKMPDALLSALKDYSSELTCASELIAWANVADMFPKSTTITLENDIALTPEQAAQYVEANEFKGTFNGNNHKISGLTTPLFGNLLGAIVKDVEIEANIVSNGKKESPFIGTDYGVGILAHYAYADQGQAVPSISGVTTRGTLKVSGVSANHEFNVGGVVGSSNGVPISNCTNYAKVTVENSTLTGSNSRIIVGGIVGVVQTNTKANLTNCTNAAGADIKVTSTCTSGGSVPVAGIAAYIVQAVTVDGCVNNATVTNEAAAGSNSLTAGIAAFINAAVKVKNCKNNENATILCASTSATEQAQHTGGIVAYYNKEANITACKNYANVKLASAKNATCVTAGIAAYTYTKTTITSCENYGDIEDASTYATAKTHNVGGIIGALEGSEPQSGKSNINISGCKNFGDVVNNAVANGTAQVGGILGQCNKSYLVVTGCENGSATVHPKVYNKNSCSPCYMGGIIGAIPKCITLETCKNYGEIKNSGLVNGTSNLYCRLGGIVGNSVQGAPGGDVAQQSVYTSCENYGDIVNDSNTVKEVRLGGIIGSSSSQKVLVTLCKNFGDVYETEKATSAPTDLCLGGISGYTGNAGSQFEGCISKATITQRSASTLKRCGEIIGWFNSSSAWTLKDNKIAGTVNGAAVTADNCKKAGFLFGTKAASDANTTGLATNGYYTE